MNARSFSAFIAEGEIPTRSGSIRTPNDQFSKPTIVYSVLKELWEAGDRGMAYSDILKYIFKYHRGIKYQSNVHRGHYSTSLSGMKVTGGYGPNRQYTPSGILPRFCEKNETGRWVLASTEIQMYFNALDKGQVMDKEILKVIRDLF